MWAVAAGASTTPTSSCARRGRAHSTACAPASRTKRKSTHSHASRTQAGWAHSLHARCSCANTHIHTHTTDSHERTPPSSADTSSYHNRIEPLYERRHIMHTLDPFNQSVPQHHIHIRGTHRHRVRACLVAGRPAGPKVRSTVLGVAAHRPITPAHVLPRSWTFPRP